MEFYRRYKKELDKILFYLIFIFLVYIFVTVLFWYVAPFLIALLISVVFEPLAKFLNQRFKIPRGILGLFCIILVFLFIGILGTNIFAKIIEQGQSFSSSVPYYLQEVARTVEQVKVSYSNIVELMPEEFHNATETLWPTLAVEITNLIKDMFASASASVVKNFPGTLLAVAFCFVSTFFLVKDKPKINDFIMKKSHPAIIRGYTIVKNVVFEALGGYIKAQLIIMSVTSTIAIVGLMLLKYPYALLVGLLIALVDALPVLGSGFVLWPWALFCALTGDYGQAIGLLFVYATIIITRQVLEPKVLATQIGIYPVVLLMSIYIGLKVFGPMGFLIGPLIVVTINALQGSDTNKKTHR